MQRGDGSSASGKVGYDVLSLGGLTIKEQAIQLAAAPSPQFSHGTMDGIMGLAFRKLNTIHFEGKPFPHATPAENAWRQEDIPVEAGVFTCAVYSTRDPEGDKSFYTFGWIDRYLVQQSGAEIAWTALDEASGLWMFPSERATVGGTPVPRPGNKAIADSGTALVLLSDNVCRELYAQIRGAEYSERDQGYTVPRDITLDELPELRVAIGGTEFAIQKQDLVFAPLDENRWYGGVQSRGENPFDILGDTFLKSVYAVSLSLSLSLSLLPPLQVDVCCVFKTNPVGRTDLGQGQHALRRGAQDGQDAERRAQRAAPGGARAGNRGGEDLCQVGVWRHLVGVSCQSLRESRPVLTGRLCWG